MCHFFGNVAKWHVCGIGKRAPGNEVNKVIADAAFIVSRQHLRASAARRGRWRREMALYLAQGVACCRAASRGRRFVYRLRAHRPARGPVSAGGR